MRTHNRWIEGAMWSRISSLILSGIIVLALTARVHADSGITAESDIRFTVGGGYVPALDPDNPDKLLEDKTGILETTASTSPALAIDAVPLLRFANADGSPFPVTLTGERIYPLYRPSRPFIQVSDLRGAGGGWRLAVRADQFSIQGAPGLEGAEIRFLNGDAVSSNTALRKPAVNDTVRVLCGETSTAVTICDTLGSDTGMGAWTIRWYAGAGDICLYLPTGCRMKMGEYTTTLHWELIDSI